MGGGSRDDHGLVGQKLGDRYRIVAPLGHGGMASVYRAEDERLNRTVVVKVPHRALLADDAMRQRFLAEIRDHARHEHPSVLGIIDQGLHEGLPYAVLQFLGGGDLSARFQDEGGRSSVASIAAWLVPIARALDVIHQSGSLHRDVKPGNILFDDHGHPFLSDFGIATAIDRIDAEAETIPPREQLTVAGHFIGSPAYAPPEAIDRIFTPAYDQYALATVVYLGLTGRLPFEGKTNEAILIAKSQTRPTAFSELSPPPAVSQEAEAAIGRALAQAPEDRFPSCGAFASAFVEAAPASRPAATGRGTPAPKTRWLAIVAVVLLLGLLAWLGIGRPRGGPEGRAPTAMLGSTAEERAQALALCEQYGGGCEPAEFATETERPYRAQAIQLDRYEVTRADFARYAEPLRLKTQAEAAGYSLDGPTRRYGASWRNPSGTTEATPADRRPVVHVTLAEAEAFCAAMGKRLPTADEWEFAARGPERRQFPWGDPWDPDRVRSPTLPGFGLEPVGQFPSGATPEGLEDMAGSVWEWTSTRDREGQVLKGGSWDSAHPASFRGAAAARVDPETTASDIGFRCAREDGASEATPTPP